MVHTVYPGIASDDSALGKLQLGKLYLDLLVFQSQSLDSHDLSSVAIGVKVWSQTHVALYPLRGEINDSFMDLVLRWILDRGLIRKGIRRRMYCVPQIVANESFSADVRQCCSVVLCFEIGYYVCFGRLFQRDSLELYIDILWPYALEEPGGSVDLFRGKWREGMGNLLLDALHVRARRDMFDRHVEDQL